VSFKRDKTKINVKRHQKERKIKNWINQNDKLKENKKYEKFDTFDPEYRIISIALFFPSRPRFISNPWEATVVVIYSSNTLVTSSIFISSDLRVYCRVVC
jgi:hypothetical protein